MRRTERRGPFTTATRIGAVAVLGYGLLLIPTPTPTPPEATTEAFAWNQDERWLTLEQRFREVGALGCEQLRRPISDDLGHLEGLLADLAVREIGPEAAVLDTVEERTFQLAPMVAVCREWLPSYTELVTRTRSTIKRQSERWDLDDGGKDRLYRLLWGGRAALEEVMLQGPVDSVSPLVRGDDEPSATPATTWNGVALHSGDLLVSRGGAPISALIAVGSDYPGNFSHVGLIHVDPVTGESHVIHSNHNGLQVESLDDHIAGVKLRMMVLRPRADLPVLLVDPMAPHRAAEWGLRRARQGHTPYDFAIDHSDDSRMYCSEVPARAYENVGITLWMALSRVSRPGIRAWLADLGARHFNLQEPSDLEYDPQLRVVAEWRDPGTLYLDHVDNVVTEAMLEGADRGDRLTYPWYRLPVVRAAKLYSMAVRLIGKPGPVPAGLGATEAARVVTLRHRHAAIKARVLVQADEFRARTGYTPPEWQLLRFAKEARDAM